MRCWLVLITLIGLLGNAPLWALDPAYHSIAEVYQEILAWQQLYPDTVRVDTIGYSQQDNLPIWAVKLSDNVQQDEDEPTLLFVGQVHAEEIIGVEICLQMISDILNHRQQNPYRTWLQKLELWIVPTANPEGHQVVMDTLDESYRKNKNDCNNSGSFDFVSGLGGDIDGVDINRNFPLNWAKGDTFMQPGGQEYYDYFRGFSPLSESETRALWDLGAREKFGFSVVWHSSRSGNFAQKVYYPWNWETSGKLPPDFPTISYMGTEVAYHIPKYSGGGYYEPSPTDAPRGCQHDNFYASLGVIAYLIECSETVQPPYWVAEQVAADNLTGVYLLLDRAAGTGSLSYYSQLSGVVKDAVSGLPLPAVVRIPSLDSPYFTPRTCDATYGRYRRYLMPGTYDLEVRLRGYVPQTISGLIVNPSGTTTRNVNLAPKPWYTLQGELRALNGSALPGTIYIFGEDVEDTLTVAGDGQFVHSLPEGEYWLIIDSPGRVVRHDNISLHQYRFISYEFDDGEALLNEDFSAGLANWQSGGVNDRWGISTADSLWSGGQIAAQSPGADYLASSQSWLELTASLDLQAYVAASLSFRHWYDLEPGCDSAVVQISADGADWATVAGPFSGQDVGWGAGYADLTPFCGSSNVRLRFWVATDSTLNLRGWRLDEIIVMAADTLLVVATESQKPRNYALYSAYPNPFNAQLSIGLELSHQQEVDVSLWNLLGERVNSIASGRFSAGKHRLHFRPDESLATGIYILRITNGNDEHVRKVVFLK